MNVHTSLCYSGTSIAAIAKEIGIQKSSLYAHFADKEQLFLEVFQRFHDETALKLSAIFLTELPDKEKLHEVFCCSAPAGTPASSGSAYDWPLQHEQMRIGVVMAKSHQNAK